MRLRQVVETRVTTDELSAKRVEAEDAGDVGAVEIGLKLSKVVISGEA